MRENIRSVVGGVLPIVAVMAFARAHAAPIDFVDTLVGTEGAGTEYGGTMPYVGVPFGSVNAVAMTRTNRIGVTSFNASDEMLLGVILTRQPTIWMGEWGEVTVPLKRPRKIAGIRFAPHVAKVRSTDGLEVEFTATAHAAWIRFSADDVAEPVENGFSTRRDDAHLGYELPNFKGWRYVERPDARTLRIGVSLISLEQARENLRREMPAGVSFEETVRSVGRAWDDQLGRIGIDASDDVKRIFYTALYHCSLFPRRIDEYGRYYSGIDDRVHEGKMYTCFSLWDTYRAEHPLLTLLNPERVDDMMASLLAMYREGGWLPKWPNLCYTGAMVGAPAEVVLAEAYVKGFRGFDLSLAYEAVKKNATVPQTNDRTFVWEDRGIFGHTPETRGGLTSFMTRGYVAADETTESVSRTQDFCLDDLSAAILAEATGHADDAARFRARAKNYTNLWNAAVKEFRPKDAAGRFCDPSVRVRSPRGGDYGAYCEQSAYTGVWAIPFDTDGLVKLMGGREEAIRRLDDFFDNYFWKVDTVGNLSVHGNEPSHHCAYLYNRFGAPEKTQRRVREILTRAYTTGRRGFDGNEDCGQMSAWYVLSALGFYPIDPASGEYELGSPVVRSATLRIGAPYPAATLRIEVRPFSPERWRVRRVTLNGRELSDWRVRHADLVRGGELIYEME